MTDTPEQNAGAPADTPFQAAEAPAAQAATAAGSGSVGDAGPASAPPPDEAPTMAQTVVTPPAPPAPPVAVAGQSRRPWWHYAIGAGAAAAILIGVFLGGVAVGKDAGPDFGDHRGFAQMMPGYGDQNGGQMPYGQDGQTMPYGQGGRGWDDDGTSPHGWGRQGDRDWDQDGDHWGGQQPYGQQATPTSAPSVQTQ